MPSVKEDNESEDNKAISVIYIAGIVNSEVSKRKVTQWLRMRRNIVESLKKILNLINI